MRACWNSFFPDIDERIQSTISPFLSKLRRAFQLNTICLIISPFWFPVFPPVFYPSFLFPSNPSDQFSRGSAFPSRLHVYPVGSACHSVPLPISTTTSTPISRVFPELPKGTNRSRLSSSQRLTIPGKLPCCFCKRRRSLPSWSQRSIILPLLSSSILPGRRLESTCHPGASTDSCGCQLTMNSRSSPNPSTPFISNTAPPSTPKYPRNLLFTRQWTQAREQPKRGRRPDRTEYTRT